ncbi:MAG: hypothetical protein LUD25_03850 [Coriobacteriaceae bacterium]|nr:hypothetical protein [Coriobacteriaceae bacterium]
MSDVYVHIGPPKTGSSSIQFFLDDNQAALEQHGICFPIFERRWKRISPRRNGHIIVAGWKTPQGTPPLDEPRECYREGLDLIAQAAQGHDAVILSDESFWECGHRNPKFWPQFKQDLADRGLNLRLICYLRRQDLWIQSYYKEKVKTRTSLPFSDYLVECEQRRFFTDYGAYLDMLNGTFERDDVFVRIMESGQFAGAEQTIQSDFLDILGLSLSDGFKVKSEVRNQALSGTALEISRLLNGLDEGKVSGKTTRKAVKELQASKPPEEKVTLFASFQAQKDYLDSYAASNEHVARAYLAREDGVLFHEPITELPPQHIDEHDLLDDSVKVLGRSIQLLEEENSQLKKELEELKGAAPAKRKKK